MNKVILMGRLTRNPEIRLSRSVNSTKIARYTLAVDRKYKVQGQAEVDFINCTAFGKNAEFVEKYLRKGMKISIVGRIQVHVSDSDGTRRYYTEVIVDEHEFAESKVAYEARMNVGKSDSGFTGGEESGEGFVPVGVDDEVPF